MGTSMLPSKFLVYGVVRVLKLVVPVIVNPALLFRTQIAILQPLVQCSVLRSQPFMRLVVLVFQPFMESLVAGIPAMLLAIMRQDDRGYGQHHKPRQHQCS